MFKRRKNSEILPIKNSLNVSLDWAVNKISNHLLCCYTYFLQKRFMRFFVLNGSNENVYLSIGALELTRKIKKQSKISS